MPNLDFVSRYNLFTAGASADGCSFLTACTDVHQIVYHQNEWNFSDLLLYGGLVRDNVDVFILQDNLQLNLNEDMIRY